MKAQLLMLSAAGLLLASVAQAGPISLEDRFVQNTREDVAARLAERGVDVAGTPLSISIGIGPNRISGVKVARSSGSSELDARAISAIRNLRTDQAPTELIGRNLVLTLGDPAPHKAASAQ